MDIEETSLREDPATESRAVIVCGRPGEGLVHHLQNVRLDSPFVAQLIATADNLPQTRHRRRAEPRVALAAYTATPTLPSSLTRRVA